MGPEYQWMIARRTPALTLATKTLGIFYCCRGRAEQIRQSPTPKPARRKFLICWKKYGVRRAIIHWYSGPMDVLQGDDRFRAATSPSVLNCSTRTTSSKSPEAVPDHLLLTETDNPGALKWLKKDDELGMPSAITSVINTLATVRRALTRRSSNRLVEENFTRLVGDDPGLRAFARLFSPADRPPYRRSSRFAATSTAPQKSLKRALIGQGKGGAGIFAEFLRKMLRRFSE